MKMKSKIWDGEFDNLFENNGVYTNNYFVKKYGGYKRCYFDKVNGSFGKKKKIYKSKKYWFYEFENIINERSIVKLFESEKNKYLSFKYIDRVGWFISLIYLELKLKSGVRDNNEINIGKNYVYVSYNDVEGILGVDFKMILNKLIDIDLIFVKSLGKNKNKRSVNLVGYGLNEKLLGKRINKKYLENYVLVKRIEGKKNIEYYNKNEIENIKRLSLNIESGKLDKILEEKLERKKNEIRKELSWGRMFNKDEEIIKKEIFLKGDGEEYKEIIRNRYFIFRDKINDVKNGVIHRRLFYSDSFFHRSYNIINGLDKEFRKELRVDGEELVELDIKSCHISSILYFLERIEWMKSEEYSKLKRKEYLNINKNRILLNNNISKYKDDKVNIKLWKKRIKEINKEEKKLIDEFGFNYDYNNINVSGELILKSVKINEWWEDRFKLFGELYDLDDNGIKKYYNWGDNKEDDINKLIKRIKNEDDYYKVYNEINNLLIGVRRLGLIDGNELNRFGINKNLLNFKRSDNLIEEIKDINYIYKNRIDNRYEKSKMVDGKFIFGIDWKNEWNYDDYKVIIGELKNKVNKEGSEGGINKWLVENEELIKIQEKDYKSIIESGKYYYFDENISKKEEYSIKKYLDKYEDVEFRRLKNLIGDNILYQFNLEEDINKLEIKIGEIEDLNILEYDIKSVLDFNWVVGNYEINWNKIKDEFRSRYINGYKIKNKKKEYISLKNNVEFDSSNSKVVDGYEFVRKNKDFIVGDDSDYYNYLKFRYGFGVYKFIESLNEYGNVNEWNDNKIFNRDFYKMLVLRLLFSETYLSNSLKNNIYNDLMENIFGSDFKEYIEVIKNYDFKKDVFGNNVKVDFKNRYKNLNKILGVIEVDVINYLENRYFIDEDFYVKIFDGIMIKKKNFNRNRIEVNYILKNEIGYMFEMK